MARRPDDTKGSLIYQEGKEIEGDYYIIAVYDDPASYRVTFSAYELENDCTYTYPITYSDFDHLFRFHSKLLNPKMVQGRYEWVINRLQFVEDAMGNKRMVLDPEVVARDGEVGEEEEDQGEEVVASPKNAGVQPAAAGSGAVDAATRARLLQELDTHDDEKLLRQLVKSEAARKRFIAELFAKRQLEQLKASQRLQKADEERESRLARLDIIKQQQLAKAEQHKRDEEARKTAMEQMQVLLQREEASAIRRLIQEKDEQDRGMGREKDAARQRRKMQERSAAEVAAIENQRAQQLARNREQQVLKREQLIKSKDREEYDAVKKFEKAAKETTLRRRKEKDAIIEEVWQQIHEANEEKQGKYAEFVRLEEVREERLHAKWLKRAKSERENWEELREFDEQEKQEIDQRRRAAHKQYLMDWQVDATKRAVAVRENELKSDLRVKKLQDRAKAKLMRAQLAAECGERSRSPSPKHEQSKDVTMLPGDPKAAAKAKAKAKAKARAKASGAEATAPLDKKTEKEESARRHSAEVLRIHDQRVKDENLRLQIENSKVSGELAAEQEHRERVERMVKREETFAMLEESRRERSLERERKRDEACRKKVKTLAVGVDLPMYMIA